MIGKSKPLSLAETMEYAKKGEGETDVIGFIKKFNKLKIKDAEKLKEEIKNLDLIRIRPEHVIKLIDILPENEDELNKIFVDTDLDEDEKRKILETIKKFR